MRRNNKVFILTAAFLLLLLSGACTSEPELADAGSTENTSGTGTVRFTLGGSTGKTATRADGTAQMQTEEERKVETLLAVVFRDASGDAATGANDQEDNADTFFKVIEILKAGDNIQKPEGYSFEVGEPGRYHICFVANPGNALKGKIQAFGTDKTVQDFKTLEGDQDPDTTPMLMTSGFYGANIGTSADTDLGKVILTRAMARIDILNLADGITVTKAVFKNRTERTVLISDAPSLNEDYLAEKEYADMDLKGDSDPGSVSNSYTSKIYSYEQYGKSADGKAPVMEISYKLDGDDTREYRHAVVFRDATPEDVPLKRNSLYRIRISNSGAGIRFSLGVADWNEGEEFEISGDQIADGLGNEGKDYANAAVGDIMLSDGKLISKDATLTDNEKKKAIGIVTYLYKDQSRVGQSVKSKLGHDAIGIVLALKNASENIKWAEPEQEEIYQLYDKVGNAYANSFDGYFITNKILTEKSTFYPAFGSVKKFRNSVVAPINTTDWYIPSLGEWADILSNDNGIGGIDISKVKNEQTNNYAIMDGAQAIAINALNTALNKISSNNVDVFNTNQWYWSSSEHSILSAYVVDFQNSNLSCGSNGKKNEGRVPCVLAF